MIGRIRGILIDNEAPDLLIEAMGVGYELQAPISTCIQLPAPGEEVILHTHLSVSENAQLLFGFISLRDRRLFRELIKVSGSTDVGCNLPSVTHNSLHNKLTYY